MYAFFVDSVLYQITYNTYLFQLSNERKYIKNTSTYKVMVFAYFHLDVYDESHIDFSNEFIREKSISLNTPT